MDLAMLSALGPSTLCYVVPLATLALPPHSSPPSAPPPPFALAVCC